MKSIRNNGVLYYPNGAIINCVRNGEDDKFFGVVAMCGHCGYGYFIPILFSVKAKDLKSAVEYAKNFPRVKI